MIPILLNDVGAVPQVDVVATVRPVFQQQTAVLAVERVQRHINGTADLQRAAK